MFRCCRFRLLPLALAAFCSLQVSETAWGAPATLTIDGRAARSVPLDVIQTPSGEWPVFDLGRVAEGRAYLFTYRAKPDWFSLCIVRAPDGDGSIDDRPYDVTVDGQTMPITVLPGSMKCADTGEPVTPTMARLAQAVRIP